MEVLRILVFVLAAGLSHALPQLAPSRDVINKVDIQQNKANVKRIVKREVKSLFEEHSTYKAESNDNRCYVCRPGFYRIDDCQTNMTVGQCAKCPPGTYNNNYNIAMYCAECSVHCLDLNAEVVRPCNATADMKCRCKDGFYNHSKGPGEWICMTHSQCVPGEEPSQKGTAMNDTKCKKCKEGWYSPIKSSTDSCIRCKECGSGQQTNVCDGTRDTECSSDDQNKTAIILLAVLLPIGVLVVIIVVIYLVYIYRKRINEMEPDSSVIDFNQAYRVTEHPCLQVVGNHNTIPTENNWTNAFSHISRQINLEHWKPVIRSILSKYYNASEIDSILKAISYDYQRDGLTEEVYQAFMRWHKRSGHEACLDDIVEALEQDHICDHNTLASQLRKRYPSLLKR